MSNWITEFKGEVRELKAYAAELERQLEEAKESLQDISQGVGRKPHWYNSARHTWEEALKFKAVSDLKRICSMPLRRKPTIWRL